MNVLHITDDFSPAGWGLKTAISELSGQLGRLGISQSIISPSLDLAQANEISENVDIRRLPLRPCLKRFRFPQNFNEAFDQASTGNSLIHLHGIWMAPQHLAAQRASSKSIPYCISPHNMLGDWSKKKDGWLRPIRRRLFWEMVSRYFYRKVNAIHALNVIERDAIYTCFPKKRIEVIPNGIDLKSVDRFLTSDFLEQGEVNHEKYILIFGRLHPIKGIELFLKALSRIIPSSRIHTVIAGPPHSQSYLNKLKMMVMSNGLENDVTFHKPVFGQDKWRLISKAWAICAPSFSEGISMTALEGMSASIPVITTHAAGIYNIPDGGGILIESDEDDLRDALLQVKSWSDNERKPRGLAARKLIERHYSWDVIGQQYVDFYQEILKNPIA
jgi:glycosyltransferase involved in cell wall biosynthesis